MNLPTSMSFIAHDPAGGDADSLRVADGPLPVLKPGDLLIRVEAAGINRPDLMQRKGLYPPPPDASPELGLDVAGTVAALGAPRPDRGTGGGFAVGDRVCALVNGGGYAEYCAVAGSQCLPWPGGFDAVRAAALPETFFTVWSNLFRTGGLAENESVLIHGGTSGIGSVAVQLARAFGARVFATVGTAEKAAIAAGLGAERAINYRTEDFAEVVTQLTGGRGVDIVLDLMGAPYLDRNLACLADLGRLVLVSVQGGAVAERLDLRRIMTGRLSVTGTTMRPRSAAFKGEIASALREKVWPLLESGEVKPLVHAVFPFRDAARAHRLMEQGDHAGKIVLAMS